MTNHVLSISEIGASGILVPVECRITNGLPTIVIVGYANKSLEEAKERLRGAFSSSQLQLPRKRITLNLAPGDIPKDGTSFDLAMAIAILLANRAPLLKQLKDTIIIGELSLDGSVRPVRGIIGKLLAAKKHCANRCFIPVANLTQAQLIPGLELFGVSSLLDLYNHLLGRELLLKQLPPQFSVSSSHPALDLALIAGQETGKRAIEIAAAGEHNLFLSGPPGTGKTMLARALPGLLPPLNANEMIEVTHLHSLASSNFDTVIRERPFRNPHHTSSLQAMIGGGNQPTPGEISLAHRGVLFLDELPEFKRTTIEALRQPLEDGFINVARHRQSLLFPADFLLVATANPCPCGFFGTERNCLCPAHRIIQYQQKLSGPFLDRIDLFAEVQPTEHRQILTRKPKTDNSITARSRIITARNLQINRQKMLNNQLNNRALKQYANFSIEAKMGLDIAANKNQISARAYIKTVKVARTIADLAGSSQIQLPHLTEALVFRQIDS